MALDLEIWQQKAQRVKAVIVTADNLDDIATWVGDVPFAGQEDLVPGDAVVLTGQGAYADGTPKPGQFTRVEASQVDYLYRRNTEALPDREYRDLLDEFQTVERTREEEIYQAAKGPLMATSRIILPIPGGYATDGTTNNVAAIPSQDVSTGGPTTNAPFVITPILKFQPATADTHWQWAFELPGDYASGGTLAVIWSTPGTSANTVVWKAATAILVVGTTDMDTVVFDTVVTVTGTPSTTAGITTRNTVALTMTNAAANRPIVIFVGRDQDNGSDTNVNDAYLSTATFEYTS